MKESFYGTELAEELRQLFEGKLEPGIRRCEFNLGTDLTIHVEARIERRVSPESRQILREIALKYIAKRRSDRCGRCKQTRRASAAIFLSTTGERPDLLVCGQHRTHHGIGPWAIAAIVELSEADRNVALLKGEQDRAAKIDEARSRGVRICRHCGIDERCFVPPCDYEASAQKSGAGEPAKELAGAQSNPPTTGESR